MSVYYVHAPELGLVKIGHAGNVHKRLTMLQTGSPTRLVLLAVEPGGEKLERERHAQFEQLRARGEWFRFEGDLKALVEFLPPYVRQPPTRKPLPGPLGAWLHKAGLSQEDFGELIGARGATVSRICHGKMQPTSFLQRIYAVTGGEVDANALFGLSSELLNERRRAAA